MANQTVNGHEDPPPAGPGGTANQAVIDQISPPIRSAIQILIQGVATAFPQVPQHVLISIACYEMGTAASRLLQSDLTTMIKLRGIYKKSFEDGCKAAPLMQQPSGWVPPAEGGGQ